MSKKKSPPIAEQTLLQVHQQAMEFYVRGLQAEEIEDQTEAERNFLLAFEYESEAASRLAFKLDKEPTRSIILKSAAVMALKCKDIRQAERLISTALAGNPNNAIANELRSLLEKVNFERHLEVRGVTLAKNEFQLALTGSAVGEGDVESDEFVVRIQATEKIVFRTVERQMNVKFREAGRPGPGVARKFPLFLSAPRAGSFTLTLRMGLPREQMYFDGMENLDVPKPEDTINNIMDCFDAINNNDDERLQALIPDEAYRRNFSALARQLAPDGDRIRMVGITAGEGANGSRVAINRTRGEFSLTAPGDERPEGEVVVTGNLLFANSAAKSKSIKVVDDNGVEHRFYVPEGYMDDIVKPFWANRVRVVGFREGKKRIVFSTIDVVPDGS